MHQCGFRAGWQTLRFDVHGVFPPGIGEVVDGP
jgi:hypothetical protein